MSPTYISKLVGVWELVEQYADPSDGCGDFRKVDTDKIIEFFDEGVQISNGKLCGLDGSSATNTYDVHESFSEISTDNYYVLRLAVI